MFLVINTVSEPGGRVYPWGCVSVHVWSSSVFLSKCGAPHVRGVVGGSQDPLIYTLFYHSPIAQVFGVSSY